MELVVGICQGLSHGEKGAKADELQDRRHQVEILPHASGFEQGLLEGGEESERLRHELARLQFGYDAVTRIRRERDRLRARVKTLHNEWRPSAVMVISGPTSRRAA